MLLSVVVSVFSLNRLGDLRDLLDGLAQQTYKNLEVVIIVDENKELFEKVAAYINSNKYTNVYIVFNDVNKGLSYSRNVGIDHSNGEIISFIDDDAIPNNYWAEKIVDSFLEDETIGALTGEIIPLWEYDKMSWFPKELHWMISCSYVMTPSTKQEFERGFGTNMAFKKEIFDKVGKFDINFGLNVKKWVGGEDSDMFLRVKKVGMKVLFNPDVCVQHKIYYYRIKLKNIAKRAFNGGSSVHQMKKRIKYSLNQSTEHRYLKYIFFTSFPGMIQGVFSKNFLLCLKQICIIIYVLFFELIGFLYGYCFSFIDKLKFERIQ